MTDDEFVEILDNLENGTRNLIDKIHPRMNYHDVNEAVGELAHDFRDAYKALDVRIPSEREI
jgi:hypothetical protein